tara:strand:- start:28429 stop:29151 length:723 start_codon:yes stop_codon:yes gene_type:complete
MNEDQVEDTQAQTPDAQATEQNSSSAPASSLTPEAIAAAVAQGMQQNAPKPQMSEEETRKAMNMWSPDEEFANSFATALTPNEDGQIDRNALKGVFGSFHSNTMKQAETFAKALVAQSQQQYKSEFAPINEYVQTQQQQQLKGGFVKAYPALKQYEQLLPMAAKQLQASGANYTTPEQLYPALAGAMEQMVKTFVPTFSMNGTQNPGNSGGTAPASLMNGGQGGGNSAPATNGKSASIWG